jgi:hypothetical protein
LEQAKDLAPVLLPECEKTQGGLGMRLAEYRRYGLQQSIPVQEFDQLRKNWAEQWTFLEETTPR